MRALDYLIRLYPEKTGAEIIAIQEQDKLDDQREYEERNEKKLAFIKDINENGGYYRGRFGLDQYYFYRVFDLEIESNGTVIMKVEKLVMFYNPTDDKHHVTAPNEIRIERRIKDYEKLDQYGLENENRVTKEDWDKVNNYVNAMSEMFWDDIKWS